MVVSTRATAQKKLAAAALAGLLSAGALTAAGEVAQAQTQEDGGEVVNREVVVNEDRDYTGLWGLLGLLGLLGLAGLRRKKDDNVDVRRSPSAERGSSAGGSVAGGSSADGGRDARRGAARDSEVVSGTEDRGGANVRRGNVRDSEVVASTEGKGIDGDEVRVDRDAAEVRDGSRGPGDGETPSKKRKR